MNSWSVISERFPFIPVRIEVADDQIAVEALIDTGFDGDIVLPAGTRVPGPSAQSALRARLADGTYVQAPVFRAAAVIGPVRVRPVVVILLGDLPMIGRRLIGRFAVTLDHGQRVIVQP
jgi:predicted aspartyl protease